MLRSGRPDLLRSGPDLLRSGTDLLCCPQLLQSLLQAVVLGSAALQAEEHVPPQQVLQAELLRADLLRAQLRCCSELRCRSELRCSGPDLLRSLNLIDR